MPEEQRNSVSGRDQHSTACLQVLREQQQQGIRVRRAAGAAAGSWRCDRLQHVRDGAQRRDAAIVLQQLLQASGTLHGTQPLAHPLVFSIANTNSCEVTRLSLYRIAQKNPIGPMLSYCRPLWQVRWSVMLHLDRKGSEVQHLQRRRNAQHAHEVALQQADQQLGIRRGHPRRRLQIHLGNMKVVWLRTLPAANPRS